ncbi:MAG: hypothetical protein K1X64_22515 [Myxococcaceae bacterium]|nr:hypothetical protein [Myxococcaceae bacterium]
MRFWSEWFKPNREAFLQEVLSAFNEQLPSARVVALEEAFRIKVDQGPQVGFCSLEQPYAQYAKLPEGARAGFVREWVLSFPLENVHGALEEHGARLLPKVISNVASNIGIFEKIAHIDIEGVNTVEDVVGKINIERGEPLVDGLSVKIAFDAGRSVSDEQLKRWQISHRAAMTRAVRNLAERSLGEWHAVVPGAWRSPWKDSNDAARLLVPEVLSRLPIRGQPVAYTPHADALIIVGSDDWPALLALNGWVTEQFTRHRPLSLRPYIFEGGRWQAWSPSDARLSRMVKGQRAFERHVFYEAQKSALTPFTESFIAAHRAVKSEDVFTPSMTQWSEGVTTWLPEADRLVLLKGGAAQASVAGVVVDFEAMHRLAPGALARVEGVEPPLWQAVRWPERHEIHAMVQERKRRQRDTHEISAGLASIST